MSLLPMGTAIQRRYVLVGPVGHGGISTVYQAVDAVEGRVRAVKLLAAALADDRRARDNLWREALITDRLRHPSVPRIFDHGDAVLPDGTNLPYVVMELLNGVSLAGRLAGGPLPWRQAVSIAATAADVLAVAHLRGVVHRDLSPQNVMMTRTGIKIIDFGLASADTGRPGPDGRTGRSGARPADDVYALGVLLYQMVTGRSPYPGATPATFLAAGRTAALAPTPVLAVAGLPRQVADLCRACMSKHPDDRPTSIDAALALWAVLAPSAPARWTAACP